MLLCGHSFCSNCLDLMKAWDSNKKCNNCNNKIKFIIPSLTTNSADFNHVIRNKVDGFNLSRVPDSELIITKLYSDNSGILVQSYNAVGMASTLYLTICEGNPHPEYYGSIYTVRESKPPKEDVQACELFNLMEEIRAINERLEITTN